MRKPARLSTLLILIAAFSCSSSPSDPADDAGAGPSAVDTGTAANPPVQLKTAGNPNPNPSSASGIRTAASGSSAAPATPSSPPPAPTASAMSTAGATPPACASLTGCCVTILDPAAKKLCTTIAGGQANDVCQAATPSYCATTMTTTTPVTTTAVKGGSSCTQLTACCVTLSGTQKTACAAQAAGSDIVACSTSFTTLCPGLTPPAITIDPCADLLNTCCSTLEDDDDIDDCEMTAQAADPVACTDANMELCGDADAGDDEGGG
jgi:hypothetical protein